ncbi:MAG: flagellar hook-basal body complex protein FliE [Janthinobacterium lividum]
MESLAISAALGAAALAPGSATAHATAYAEWFEAASVMSAPGASASPQQAGGFLPALPEQHAAPAGSFAGMVSSGLEQLNAQLIGAQTGMQQFALGQAPSVHQLMVTLEESRLAFQLFLQVRNRLLESYQEVMRMQI